MGQKQGSFGLVKMNRKEIAQSITFIIVVIIIGFSLGHLLVGTTPPTQSTEAQTTAGNTVEEIDGVQVVDLSWGKFSYKPDVITVAAGKPVRIVADLERLQGCFRSFVIRDLGISTSFSSSRNFIEFTPTKTGTFAFSCAMGMGKGTLIVQ